MISHKGFDKILGTANRYRGVNGYNSCYYLPYRITRYPSKTLMSTIRHIRALMGSNLLLNWYPKLLGYTFRRAVTEKDFEIACSIRHAVYTKCGYLAAGEQWENKFHDKYDDISVTFLAFYKRTPIGTIRLTNTRQGSPVFEHFNIINAEALMSEACWEIGRFAVLEEYRKSRRFASVGLIGMCYYHSLANDIHRWVGYGPHYILKSFMLFTKPKTLPLGVLSEAHQEARQVLSGYFHKHGDHLVVFSINIAKTKPWRTLGYHLKTLISRTDE